MFKKVSISLLFLFCVVTSFSQYIKKEKITSVFLKEKRNFRVYLPSDYNTSEKYHVLYVLDANYLFDLFSSNVFYYSRRFYDVIVPTIVVAIDYKTPEYRYDIGFNIYTDMSLDSIGQNFYQYINDELVPYIDKHYSTSHLNTIVGHSYTATYLLYSILKQNNNFQQYILLAPEKPNIEVKEIGFNTSNMLSKKVVIASATNDTRGRIEFANDLYSSLLLKTNDITNIHQSLVDGTHLSFIPSAIPIALIQLFNQYYGNNKLGTEVENDSLLNIDVVYQKIKRSNEELYNYSIRKNAYNAMIFLNKAILENDYATAQQIINEFIPSEDANLLEILGGISLQMKDTTNAEIFFNQSIAFYSKQKEDYASFNVRKQYVRAILAPKHDFKKAWETLTLTQKVQSPDAIPIFNYEKGRLCAIYNYKNTDGIMYLQSCLNQIKVLSDWGIVEGNILFYIAKCYKNINDKNIASYYIEKALKVDSQNTQYMLLQKDINSMEESENP